MPWNISQPNSIQAFYSLFQLILYLRCCLWLLSLEGPVNCLFLKHHSSECNLPASPQISRQGHLEFVASTGTESASVLNQKPACIQIICKEMHFDRIIRMLSVWVWVCVCFLGEDRVTQKLNLSFLLLILLTWQPSDRSSTLEPFYLIPLFFLPPVLSEENWRRTT